MSKKKRTNSDFNKIQISNSGSTLQWTSVNFTALLATQLSRGSLSMVNNASVTLNTCIFTDMFTFSFKPTAFITKCSFIRCDLITQSEATFTECSFTNSTNTTTLLSNNPTLISYSTFTSDGTNHGIQITSGGTYNLYGNIFTGYVTGVTSGNTGNEMIYNTSNETVNI